MGSEGGRVLVPYWTRTAALVLAAVVALWFCTRATLLSLLERDYPLIGQSIAPPSPVSQALISLNRASARNGIADPLARALLENALRRAPLLADPFIVAGLDASARNDFVRAQRLMEEARRRDPRSIIPRYWLFDNYLRNGDYSRGIAEAGALIRIQPAARPAAVAVLTALLQVPRARPALAAALRRRPAWRGTFFEQAAASPRLRDPAAALLRAITPGGAAYTGQDQLAIIRGTVRAGNHARAYALWLRTLPADQRPGTPGLFDGGFRRGSEAPPFGWRLPKASSGATRIVAAPDARSGSGLAVRTEGERATLLAEQLVLSSPGPLRLTYATRALGEETGPDGAGLRVELRCDATGKILASQVVESFTPRLEAHSLPVTMRPGCGAILVRVAVAPGVEPGPLRALLTDMALSRN